MKKLSVNLSLLLLLAALLVPMVGCKKEEPIEVEETPATETSAVEAPATTDMATTDMGMSTDMASSDMMTTSDAAQK
jgi:hypothetical protein